MNFVDKVENLCKEHGITKSQLLVDLGLSRNSFVDWRKRGNIPTGDIVSAIADYFGLTMEELLDNYKKPIFVTKILFLLDSNKKSASEFIRDMGFKRNIFSLWISGDETPSDSDFLKIAKYFNIQVEYLVNENFDEPIQALDLNLDELYLISLYRDPENTRKLWGDVDLSTVIAQQKAVPTEQPLSNDELEYLRLIKTLTEDERQKLIDYAELLKRGRTQ